MEHSHYLLMGGFVFDIRPDPDEPAAFSLPSGRTHVTLTPNAIVFLAENRPNWIPDISKETIKDRSKSDAFAKALVLIQTSWFCLQSISRLGFGLPISLLELNTFAHVLCASFVYLYWWSKPHNISEPTTIDCSRGPQAGVCAAMCMRSRHYYERSCRVPKQSPSGDGDEYGFHDAVLEFEQDVDPPSDATNQSEGADNARHSLEIEAAGEADDAAEVEEFKEGDPLYITLLPGEPKYGLLFRAKLDAKAGGWVDLSRSQTPGETHAGIDMRVPQYFVKLCRVAAPALRAHEALRVSPVPRLLDGGLVAGRGTAEDFVIPHAKSWTIGVTRLNDITLSVFVAGAIYGGIHLLAWNGPFTSRTELILWRISAITVVGPGAYVFAYLSCVLALALLFLALFLVFLLGRLAYVGLGAVFNGLRRFGGREGPRDVRQDNENDATSDRREVDQKLEPEEQADPREQGEPEAAQLEEEEAQATSAGGGGFRQGFVQGFTASRKKQKANLAKGYNWGYLVSQKSGPDLVPGKKDEVFQLVGYLLSVSFLLLFLFCYILSRLFIIIEPYISLAHPVPGIFVLPNWAPYVPHIG
jgi:hypothetical protein